MDTTTYKTCERKLIRIKDMVFFWQDKYERCQDHTSFQLYREALLIGIAVAETLAELGVLEASELEQRLRDLLYILSINQLPTDDNHA